MIPRDITLILGIGNPGKAFEETYHNAGLLALRTLAACDHASAFRRPSRKTFSYARGKHYIFARSLAYMNESGVSARDACAFFRASPESLLVLHDESDLPVGTWKWSFARGAAGHKGVGSIAEHLGTHAFARLRIGIRPQETVRRKAGEFVLSALRPEDRAALTRVFGDIAAALELTSKPSPRPRSL